MKATLRNLSAYILSLPCLFLALSVSGQDQGSNGDPSEAELERYVEVKLALRDLQRERKKKIMNAIQDSELSMKGYRRVSAAQGNEEKEVSEKEQASYEETKEKVESIQAEYRDKQKDKMKDMGMEPERYREIEKMKNKESVRERIIRIKEEKMEEAQNGDN